MKKDGLTVEAEGDLVQRRQVSLYDVSAYGTDIAVV
jgi:hypothetical protein